MKRDETKPSHILKRSFLLHLLIILLTAASVSFAQDAKPKSTSGWSELLKKAWSEFDANDFDAALSTVNQVIALKPESGNAAILHFLILNRKEPERDHSADATRIIELAPSKAWIEQAYLYRANTRLLQEDYVRALYDCNGALATNSSSAHGYKMRSFAYLMKGDYETSRRDYERSLQLDPSLPSPFVVRAYWLVRRGMFPQALADYEGAIVWKPDYAEAYVDRGVVLGLLGQIDAALESLKKGRDLKMDAVLEKAYNGVGSSPFWDLDTFVIAYPKNARAYEMRGIFRLLQQNKAAAEEDFNKSIQLDPGLRLEIEKAARVFN